MLHRTEQECSCHTDTYSSLHKETKRSAFMLSLFTLTTIFAIAFGANNVLHAAGQSNTSPICGPRNFLNINLGENITVDSNPGVLTYPNQTTCEWFINGSTDADLIISFSEFATECNYDFVWVHDSLSDDTSRILAVQSGNTLPSTLVSHTGELRVTLYSDLNYVLRGLRAHIAAVAKCGRAAAIDCSGNGVCNGTTSLCACDPGWSGRACDQQACPSNCSDNGVCYNDQNCDCFDGFAGDQCQFAIEPNRWYHVPGKDESRRVGHTANLVGASDVWLVGGHDLTNNFDNAGIFSPKTNVWTQLDLTVPRYWHSTVYDETSSKLFVLGGVEADACPPLSQESVAEDGVCFKPATQVLVSIDTTTQPYVALPVSTVGDDMSLGLYGHTASVVAGGQMVVIGGQTKTAYSVNVWSFHFATSTWDEIVPTGTLFEATGHSAAYHEATGLVYIFGGFLGGSRIDSLFTYSPRTQFFTRVEPTTSIGPPVLSLHTASIVGDRMMVFGGNVHRHYSEEMCYESSTWSYSVKCNRWDKLNADALPSSDQHQGRFSHAMVEYDNATYVFGGYNGVACDDGLVLVPSQDLCVDLDAVSNESCVESSVCPDFCSTAFTTCRACASSDLCGWDESAALCVTASTFGGSNPLVSDFNTCPGDVDYVRGFLLRRFVSNVLQTHALLPLMHTSGISPTSAMREWLEGTITIAVDSVFVITTAKASQVLVYLNGSLITTINSVGVTNVTVTQGETHVIVRSGDTSNTVSVQVANASTPEMWFDVEAESSVPVAYLSLTCSESDESCQAQNCSSHTGCQTCSADYRCGWCTTDNSSLSDSCRAYDDLSTCDYVSLESSSCRTCSDHRDCQACAESNCAWTDGSIFSSSGCIEYSLGVVRNKTSPMVFDTTKCAVPCSQRLGCSECIDTEPATNPCLYCPSSNSCLDRAQYTYEGVFGSCQHWADSRLGCATCSELTSCSACLARQDCGWCQTDAASFDHKGNGTCMEGNSAYYRENASDTTLVFAEQGVCTIYTRVVSDNCSALANTNTTTTVDDAECTTVAVGEWTYDQCPNLDECSHNTTLCGSNATCHNTQGSFYCECETGYSVGGKDDAVNPNTNVGEECTPKCCANATCGLPYECDCLPGWSSANCTVDCGCNFHAVCVNDTSAAYGVCDVCLDNTEGETCDTCKPGYFGNPLDGGVCKPCACNGHGDVALNTCNHTTGECYCTDLTAGFNCDACISERNDLEYIAGDCYVLCGLNRYPNGGVVSKVKLTAKSAGITTVSMRVTNINCMWYIEAPTLNHSIRLTFTSLNVECLYDYVHIFDSDLPQKSSMIAAYAGNHTPTPIQSDTGKMLIMMRSDTSYVLPGRGFMAVYRMDVCPNGCSSRGTCNVDGVCECDDGFFGSDCSGDVCPDDCRSGVAVGCRATSSLACSCDDGWSGDNCTVAMVADTWYYTTFQIQSKYSDDYGASSAAAAIGVVSDDGVKGVTGHTVVYDHASDVSYTFGGFDLKHYINNVVKFDFNTGNTTVYQQPDNTTPWPAGRYLHSAVFYNNKMYVFGGSDDEGSYFADLWIYDTQTNTWSDVTPTIASPMSRIGHTASVVDGVMYMFGGLTSNFTVTSALYTLDLSSLVWSRVLPTTTTAFQAYPDGAFGHSAVVVDGTTLVFFGGRRLFINGKSLRIVDQKSNFVQKYDTVTNIWSVSKATLNKRCPLGQDCLARYMHTAVVVNNRYMLVFGGCPFFHGNPTADDGPYFGYQRECYSDQLLVFDLKCDGLGWLTTPPLVHQMTTPIARSAHAAILRTSPDTVGSGHLVIVGGFEGVALGDVDEYVVPLDFCDKHTTNVTCLTDTCSWNETAQECISLQLTVEANVVNGPVYTCQQTECSAMSAVEYSFSLRTMDQLPNLGCGADCSVNPSCGVCTSAVDLTARTCYNTIGKSACTEPSKDVTDLCHTQCSVLKSCGDCTDNPICTWDANVVVSAFNPSGFPCYERGKSTQAVCPAQCQADTKKECDAYGVCNWCDSSSTCFPGAVVHMEYMFGQCIEYPIPLNYNCTARAKCNDCLTIPGCGWCAAPGETGVGQCVAEAVLGDGPEVCTNLSTSFTSNNMSNVSLSWHSYQCPDVNECEVPGLDLCGPNSTCVNIDNVFTRFDIGFRCICDEGYINVSETQCLPVCEPGCVFGTCSAPNVCSCDLGFTGPLCDIDCGCNQHSTCNSGVGICDACQDNSTGLFCTECLVGSHGNATEFAPPYNGTCQPCFTVCNGHSEECTTGPDIAGPTCSNCSHNTQGDLCDVCDAWYFMDPTLQAASITNASHNEVESDSERLARIKNHVAQFDVMSACVPCQCNAHSAKACDGYSGEGCECSNLTVADFNQCSAKQKSDGSCYAVQCATCTALEVSEEAGYSTSVAGDPTNGGLCYGQLSEYDLYSSKLKPSQVAGFKISKKYNNVAIRVYIRVDIPHSVRAHAILNETISRPNPRFSSTLEYDPSIEIFNTTVSSLQEVLIWYSDRDDFSGHDLRIVLERVSDAGDPEPQFDIFFTQADSSPLHLFVFFTGFFAAFFLVLFIIGAGFAMKAAQQQRNLAAQQAVELENMATRPMAGVRMLFSKNAVTSEHAVMMAKLQANGSMYTTPLAMQPHKSDKACVSTFLIEFPSDRSNGHRKFNLGFGLTNGCAVRPPPPIINEADGSETHSPSPSSPSPSIQETIGI